MDKIKEYVAEQKPASMREIADGLGVSRPFLYDLLGGNREPSLEVAQAIERNSSGAIPITSWPKLARLLEAAKGAA